MRLHSQQVNRFALVRRKTYQSPSPYVSRRARDFLEYRDRMRKRALAVAALVLAGGACTTLDDLTGGASRDAGLDDATSDAPTAADAPNGADVNAGEAGPSDASTGDASDAPINLLRNGDFELGCAGWDLRAANVSGESLARSGASACKVCRSTMSFLLGYVTQTIDVSAGQEYYGETWQHAS